MLKRLDNIGIAVTDARRALEFYTSKLGFQGQVTDGEGAVSLGDISLSKLMTSSRRLRNSKRVASRSSAPPSARPANSASAASTTPTATCSTSSRSPEQQPQPSIFTVVMLLPIGPLTHPHR